MGGMISTPDELLDALGGNREVGATLGVQHNTVSTWRNPDRGLPAWAQAKLKAEAEARNIECDPALFEPARPKPRDGRLSDAAA